MTDDADGDRGARGAPAPRAAAAGPDPRPAVDLARAGSAAAERSALVVSIVASAVIGGGAVVWGVLATAGVLVFDGVFLLAGILLSGVSLAAARAAAAPPSAAYPFGKHAVTPLAVALQGAALLGTVVFAAADAVTTLTSGGSDANPATMLVYGVVSAALSVVVAWWLRRRAPGSDLVDAEVAQWHAGAVLSTVVGVGGAAALALDAAGVTAATRYADPVLLLVACAVIAPVPVRLIRTAARELLEAAPPPAVTAVLGEAVADVRARFGLPEPVVRATKLGRRLYVEVDFVVAPGTWDVDAEDRVRRAVVDRLRATGHEVWATVEVTTDPDLTAA